jgi:hypothetical protein
MFSDRPARELATPATSAFSVLARLGYAIFIAWSASRGSRPFEEAASRFLQNAAVLAVGLLFPVTPGRRTSIAWHAHAVPVLLRATAAGRTVRKLSR